MSPLPIGHSSVEADAALAKATVEAALRAEAYRESRRPTPPPPQASKGGRGRRPSVPKPAAPKPKPTPTPRRDDSVVLSRREWQAVQNLLGSHPETKGLIK